MEYTWVVQYQMIDMMQRTSELSRDGWTVHSFSTTHTGAGAYGSGTLWLTALFQRPVH